MASSSGNRPSPFDDFLSRNTISSISGGLPLVHSTKSLNLRELVKASGLEPTECDVFNEQLLYFFLGRPAYRWGRPESQPHHWELPTCFIFDQLPGFPIERVYPFDSGGHANGLYPSYVQNIPRENFETRNPDAPNRIVSALFGSFQRYVAGQPKSEEDLIKEFDLSVFDAEMLAVRALAGDGTPEAFDDRRFSIEIQTRDPIDFSINPPSAIILPVNYLDNADLRDAILRWNSEPITYDLYSLNLSHYHGIIFYKFMDYCKSRGFSV